MSHDIYVTIGTPSPIEVSAVQNPISVTTGLTVAVIPERILVVPIFGALVASKTLLTNFYFKVPVRIFGYGIHLDTAPLGADVTMDLLKDDVLQSRIATLASQSRGQHTNIADISYAVTEKFDIKILTTGLIGLEPGEGGTIAIHYK